MYQGVLFFIPDLRAPNKNYCKEVASSIAHLSNQHLLKAQDLVYTWHLQGVCEVLGAEAWRIASPISSEVKRLVAELVQQQLLLISPHL